MQNRLGKLRLLFRRNIGSLGSAGISGIFLLALSAAFGLEQEQAKPLIKVVVRGGTITNTLDGGIPLQQVIADIRKNFPETHRLLDGVSLEVVDLMRPGSGKATGQDFLETARTVNGVIQERAVKGVIVTQGTNTTEDIAYFLNLLVRSEKPVVVANSQRRHGTVGNDGDRNLVDAISVVLSPQAAGKGAVVVSNQTINSGREVLKTSGRPGAFVSGEHGILGIVEEDRVDFYRAPTRRHTHRSEFDVNTISALPKVEIINAYYDADPALIRAAADSGAKGLVIQGYGLEGSANGTQQPLLEKLAEKGIPIVVTARMGINNRIPVNSKDRFVEADNLAVHKARILLQLALTRTSDPREIQRIFNEY